MRKIICTILSIIILASLTGCNTTESNNTSSATEPSIIDTAPLDSSTLSSSSNSEDNLESYISDAEKSPKAIHYIVSKKTTATDGSTQKTTYFVISGSEANDYGTGTFIKVLMFKLIDNNNDDNGKCDRYICMMPVEDYNKIVKLIPDEKAFEPLTKDTDYTCNEDDKTETYSIVNSNIIYKSDALYSTTESYYKSNEAENVSPKYGEMNSKIYPYDPYCSWSQSIDTWLEDYIFLCCTQFDKSITYDRGDDE